MIHQQVHKWLVITRGYGYGLTITDLEGLNPRFFSFGPSQNSKHSWRRGEKTPPDSASHLQNLRKHRTKRTSYHLLVTVIVYYI